MTVNPGPESFSGEAKQFDEEAAINEIIGELAMLELPTEEIYGIVDALTENSNGVYHGQTDKFSFSVMRAPDGRFILKSFVRPQNNQA